MQKDNLCGADKKESHWETVGIICALITVAGWCQARGGAPLPPATRAPPTCHQLLLSHTAWGGVTSPPGGWGGGGVRLGTQGIPALVLRQRIREQGTDPLRQHCTTHQPKHGHQCGIPSISSLSRPADLLAWILQPFTVSCKVFLPKWQNEEFLPGAWEISDYGPAVPGACCDPEHGRSKNSVEARLRLVTWVRWRCWTPPRPCTAVWHRSTSSRPPATRATAGWPTPTTTASIAPTSTTFTAAQAFSSRRSAGRRGRPGPSSRTARCRPGVLARRTFRSRPAHIASRAR